MASTVAFPRHPFRITLPGGTVLDLGSRTLVMGILNVTPDSFSGGTPDADAAAARALALEADGADIIDIGGESTRPGARPVDEAEELARVVPVLERLTGRLRVPISIDTYKSGVARAALGRGASIVNDISGLQFDPGLAAAVAECGAALVLMHTRGRPATMYEQARYDDVIADVADELGRSIHMATAAGVERNRIVLDPGIGFAKRPEHSYGVLARLPELAAAVDRPLLVGASRKSFLKAAGAPLASGDRDWATAAAVTAAVLGGAHIVRVHDVGRMVQVVRVADAIRNASGPEARG